MSSPGATGSAAAPRLSHSERLGGACFWAVLAGCALALTELFVVLTLAEGKFAGLWELQWGTVWLLPSSLVQTIPLALLGSALGLGLNSKSRVLRALSAVFLAALVAIAVFSVSGGRHFEPWWRRAGVVALCAGGALWLAQRYGSPLFTHLAAQKQRAWPLLLALLLGLELLNRFALVRLYPGFHLSLSVACVLLVGAGSSVLSWPFPRLSARWGFALAGLLLATLVSLLPLSAKRLAGFDNYRWVLSEQAPLQREALRLPSALTRHEQPAGEAVTLLPSAAEAGVDLAGRDLLLITVDALRADHVGVYGYGRPTTPQLDALANDGVRFESAYCPTPHTSYSLTSLMTGKYIRPLLSQHAGADSETWAEQVRRYGYRTAAFFPPAVFFIDRPKFERFDREHLGFEYQKREFLEGEPRVQQVVTYLNGQSAEQRLFVWVHLFGPHEPYEQQEGREFGDRDIDRYDSEIAAADATLGKIVAAFRQQRPHSLVIVTADHGEEFLDHGGRYHGTTVYEEQVRVPLVMNAPGALQPRVIHEPVQTIDLLPTVLSGLQIPLRPRLRGRNLGPLLSGRKAEGKGFAYAETEHQALLARGNWRLICERQIGACKLFDLARDPAELRDVSREHGSVQEALRKQMQQFNASHGQYERDGLRAEGKGWPPALLRAMAGDGDAAVEVAALLDDADREIRRKAAEVLFRQKHPDTAAALRLAVQRDEDQQVRNYAALALTRLGQGAALTEELLNAEDLLWRRYAALALAEQGDARGEPVLVAWWSDSAPREHETSLDLLNALASIRSEDAVWPLSLSLDDVRLRPAIAQALARIGEDEARGPLAKALRSEPYQGTRGVLAEALLKLGADNELVMPLRRWLGVPDPLLSGLRIATEAGVLEHVGGPTEKELLQVQQHANLGELVTLVVPPGGNGLGIRILVEAENLSRAPARVFVGKPLGVFSFNLKGERVKSRKVPELHPEFRVALTLDPESPRALHWALAGKELGLEPGRSSHLVVFAEQGVRVHALAALPLQDEITKATASAQQDGKNEPPATKTGQQNPETP